MAHEIHFNVENGRHSVFVSGPSSWHKLERKGLGILTWKEVFEEIGGFTVDVRQLSHTNENGITFPIDAYGTFRTDIDGADSFLGVVSKKYQPMQMENGFDWVDSLLEAENGAHYETAGILGKGERYFLNARIPGLDFDVLGQDHHEGRLLFVSSFDRSLPTTVKLVTTRAVCANTVCMALREKGAEHKIRHSKKAMGKLNDIKALAKNAIVTADTIKQKFESLAQKEMTKEGMTQIFDRLFPVKEESKRETRRTNILEQILGCYESNDNNAFPEIAGTAYNLLNAITEYTDHLRGVRQTEKRGDMTESNIRAENALFGTGSDFKESALEVICEVSQGLPDRPYKSYITRAIEKGAAERANDAPVSTSLLEQIIDV